MSGAFWPEGEKHAPLILELPADLIEKLGHIRRLRFCKCLFKKRLKFFKKMDFCLQVSAEMIENQLKQDSKLGFLLIFSIIFV